MSRWWMHSPLRWRSSTTWRRCRRRAASPISPSPDEGRVRQRWVAGGCRCGLTAHALRDLARRGEADPRRVARGLQLQPPALVARDALPPARFAAAWRPEAGLGEAA